MATNTDRHESAREPALPDGAEYVRTTPMFTKESTPAGLLKSHQVAANTWAVLTVHRGSMVFAFDDSADVRVVASAATQVIPPLRPHRVTVEDGVEFDIAFYRVPADR